MLKGSCFSMSWCSRIGSRPPPLFTLHGHCIIVVRVLFPGAALVAREAYLLASRRYYIVFLTGPHLLCHRLSVLWCVILLLVVSYMTKRL